MKFDKEKIRKDLSQYWKEHKNKLHYFLNGKEVYPASISSCFFKLDETDESDEYNFEVKTLNLRIQINYKEAPYIATFFIKVVTETTSSNNIPIEEIESIYQDRIDLCKY